MSQYTGKGGCEYYHYNNIGSTMYLTKLGAISRRFAYGTYGELTMGEYGDIRFMYNGRFGVVTDENGLYQMRARYYNPVIRRFINQDVLLGDISSSQSLNRYSYCQGNPVSYLDPFGLSPYNSNSEMGHAILNLISFIPGVGDIADTINAIWYASEGNYAEALACAVGVLPFVGDVMSQGFKWTKAGKTLKFASNVGKMYVGGSGAWQNLENIRTMMANGTGGFWDYVAEGTMFLLNSATCYFGAAGVVDDLSSGIKYLQAKKADNLKALANEISGNTTIRDLDGNFDISGDEWEAYFKYQYFQDDVVRKSDGLYQGSTSSGSRFPENPNELFPENYAGLTQEIKADGKIKYTVQAGDYEYIVEYHPKHDGDDHYDGNHYHVLKRAFNSQKNKNVEFRLPNFDPNTPCVSSKYPQPRTFAPGDLLPTSNH